MIRDHYSFVKVDVGFQCVQMGSIGQCQGPRKAQEKKRVF